MKKRSILFLGSRGIPAKYGGFEEIIQFLALSIKDRGYKPIVFSSTGKKIDRFHGVKIIRILSLKMKYTSTLISTFFSLIISVTM
jgi:hypothetical protein